MAPAKLLRRALLLGLLASASAAARPSSRYTFAVPSGWVDLLAPPEDFDVTTLHPSLAIEMLRDDRLALAADLSPGNDGKNSFMQALALPALEVSEQTLPDIRRAIIERNQQDTELTIKVVSADIVDIDGSDVARIVWSVKEPSEGDEMRMAFVFSGGEDQGAMIVYGTSAAAFERTRPLLEASARATRGQAPTPKSRRLFYRALPFLQIGGVAGLLGVLLVSRRRATRPAPPKPAPAPVEPPASA